MAWVLLPDENQSQDKRVESISIPCLDAGSNPASSTQNCKTVLGAKGVLAQLVERNVRNVEVRGSTPLCSTKTPFVAFFLVHVSKEDGVLLFDDFGNSNIRQKDDIHH